MYIICREGIQALCDINEEEAVVKMCKVTVRWFRFIIIMTLVIRYDCEMHAKKMSTRVNF